MLTELYEVLSLLAPYVPFITIIGLVTIVLIRAHLSAPEVSPFSLYDFIQDKNTGKGSIEKVFILMAGLAITMWFMDLSAQHLATWEDAVAYGGLMGISKFANSWLSAKYPPK